MLFGWLMRGMDGWWSRATNCLCVWAVCLCWSLVSDVCTDFARTAAPDGFTVPYIVLALSRLKCGAIVIRFSSDRGVMDDAARSVLFGALDRNVSTVWWTSYSRSAWTVNPLDVCNILCSYIQVYRGKTFGARCSSCGINVDVVLWWYASKMQMPNGSHFAV